MVPGRTGPEGMRGPEVEPDRTRGGTRQDRTRGHGGMSRKRQPELSESEHQREPEAEGRIEARVTSAEAVAAVPEQASQF